MIYYTSDLHLFHDLVADMRDYRDGQAMAEAINAYMRDTLKKRDHLWILGDMTAGGHIPEMLRMVDGWPGVKHLVAGNHDPVWAFNRRSGRVMRKYLDVFDTVASAARRRINGGEVLLSHFPYDGDHSVEDRYASARLRDAGIPLLHGHTHSHDAYSWSKNDTFQVHVGWDAWRSLVTEAEVVNGIIRDENLKYAKAERQ